MKKRKLIFSICEIFFVAVAPILLIIYQYGFVEKTSTGFKLSVLGVILLFVAFLCAKKIIFAKKLEDWRVQYNVWMADYKTETDEAKKLALKEQIQNYNVLNVVVRSIVPILIFIFIGILAEAVEAEMIRLSAVAGLTTMFYLIGCIFSVLKEREV